MKESSKVLVGLGIGIIAGGVAGYFLSSEEGREFQRKTKAQLNQVGEDVKKIVTENREVAKNWASKVANEMQQKVSKTAETAEEITEEVSDSFQSGIEKARASINQKLEAADNNIQNAS